MNGCINNNFDIQFSIQKLFRENDNMKQEWYSKLLLQKFGMSIHILFSKSNFPKIDSIPKH